MSMFINDFFFFFTCAGCIFNCILRPRERKNALHGEQLKKKKKEEKRKTVTFQNI